ncbi:Pyridoxal kinase PdxY [Methylobacterium mesophilicum]|nr:Pyridoxal kinase PdxY [Methylobacterium mesophilicum]
MRRLGVEAWPVHTVQVSDHTGSEAWPSPVFAAQGAPGGTGRRRRQSLRQPQQVDVRLLGLSPDPV